MAVAPVSYTHLDVYKRQLFGSVERYSHNKSEYILLLHRELYIYS